MGKLCRVSTLDDNNLTVTHINRIVTGKKCWNSQSHSRTVTTGTQNNESLLKLFFFSLLFGSSLIINFIKDNSVFIFNDTWPVEEAKENQHAYRISFDSIGLIFNQYWSVSFVMAHIRQNHQLNLWIFCKRLRLWMCYMVCSSMSIVKVERVATTNCID